jgi:hypothetical protein
MSPQPTAERREHTRLAVQGGVLFYHPASGRELPGRTVNLSRGGLGMVVPPYAPLRAGQEIQFLELPEIKDGPPGEPLPAASHAHPVAATIIRVDHATLVSAGRITIAVRFGHAPG